MISGKILPHFLLRQLPVQQKIMIIEDNQHHYSLILSPPTRDVFDGIPYLQDNTIQGSRKLFLL